VVRDELQRVSVFGIPDTPGDLEEFVAEVERLRALGIGGQEEDLHLVHGMPSGVARTHLVIGIDVATAGSNGEPWSTCGQIGAILTTRRTDEMLFVLDESRVLARLLRKHTLRRLTNPS
jgi:hypothetical protein